MQLVSSTPGDVVLPCWDQAHWEIGAWPYHLPHVGTRLLEGGEPVGGFKKLQVHEDFLTRILNSSSIFLFFWKQSKKKRLPREPKTTVIIKVSSAFSLEACFVETGAAVPPLRVQGFHRAETCFITTKNGTGDNWAIMRGKCFWVLEPVLLSSHIKNCVKWKELPKVSRKWYEPTMSSRCTLSTWWAGPLVFCTPSPEVARVQDSQLHTAALTRQKGNSTPT